MQTELTLGSGFKIPEKSRVQNPNILGIEIGILKSRKNPENLKISGIGIGIRKYRKIPRKSRKIKSWKS